MSILFDGLLTQFDVKTQLDDLVSHAVQVRRDKLQKNMKNQNLNECVSTFRSLYSPEDLEQFDRLRTKTD